MREGDDDPNGHDAVMSRRRTTFEDPSEPIYTDMALFERSRSLKSFSPSDLNVKKT